MSTKSATATLEGEGLRFAITTGRGHELVVDDATGNAGPSPSELVPAALAACTGMDVISILRKKRQVVDRYEVEATGQQSDEHPHHFTRIDVVHVVEGPSVDVEAVQRSIELSATRYCSVGGTLSTGLTEVHHRYLVRSGGVERSGEVVVTGPRENPHELGARRLTVAAAR